MNKTKYNLSTFFENLKNDWKYIQLNERLNTDAGIQTNLRIKPKDGKTANVYSAGMWYILTNDEFANEGFIDAYCKGFEDGKQFITNKTNNALNGFYKSCTKEYTNELQYAYFFNAENYILGYKNGACGVPINFYIDSIESIGFSAGVVTTIDLMAKENPILFDGFYDVDTEAPQQLKTVNPDEVLKNEFKMIFKNDIGFTIFTKMFELYKDEIKYHLANFSFLFFAMEKDFLVCSQTKFKEFLREEKYNIEIEKIDPRQWRFDMNENKKSKLYNVIKESLQKKHGLSTI